MSLDPRERDSIPAQPPTPTRCQHCDAFPSWPRSHAGPRLCHACWQATDTRLAAQFADLDHE